MIDNKKFIFKQQSKIPIQNFENISVRPESTGLIIQIKKIQSREILISDWPFFQG
jgi:hypothetical protein